MTNITSVNGQITDAATQSNVTVFAASPSVAVATLLQSLAQNTGRRMLDAADDQQRIDMLAQAAAGRGVMQIYGTGDASGAQDAKEPGK